MIAALVTGASSGIGEQFAYALAKEGRNLVLVARREDRLTSVAETARKLGAGDIKIIAADLSKRSAAVQLASRLELEQWEVDLLINNAGFGSRGRFTQLPLERELSEIELNVGAVVAMTRVFGAAMVQRGSGIIINVASIAGFQPVPFMATYAASKSFVVSFSLAIAGELTGTGVTVTALCPGPVPTEFQSIAGIENLRIPPIGVVDAKTVAEQGLTAARRGKSLVVCGKLNSFMSGAARLFPRRLVARIAGSIYRPDD
jgi:short-subunit dehydrogenase